MFYITSFLSSVFNMLASGYVGDFDNANKGSYKTDADNKWMDMLRVLVEIVDQFMPVIMIGLGFVGAIFIIILSVRYAKAESDDARSEAKKKLINTAIGVVIGLLIMVVLAVWLKNSNSIATWLSDFGKKKK